MKRFLFSFALFALSLGDAGAASRFWVGGTGNLNDTAHWAPSSGAGGGSSVPGSSDTATFDGASGGGTVTCNTNFTILTWTSSAFTGTICNSTDAFSPTITGSAGTGLVDAATGVHTINMGTGTWTVNALANSTVWNITASANLTLNANSSTLLFSPGASSSGIRFGSKTYNIVQFAAGRWLVTATGGTIATLTFAAGTNLTVATGLTLTVTNAPTWSGTRAAPIVLSEDSVGTLPIFSIASGTASCDWCIFSAITASGGATFNATNSISYGNTTGWTILSGPTAGGLIGGGL